MPHKSSNVPSSILYSAIGTESMRIARASNNPESLQLEHLLLVWAGRGVSIGKVCSSILNVFNKRHWDFNNVCQSKQELLTLIS